jgi:hypothetical protein
MEDRSEQYFTDGVDRFRHGLFFKAPRCLIGAGYLRPPTRAQIRAASKKRNTG